MKKWEYKTIKKMSFFKEGKINELGIDGWELVNFTSPSVGTVNFCFIFKREIKN
ncbi:MAG: DUF4177 domain-containing protein [Mycoplasmataceae bacterium]|nr:DUF4177 domain-containing protein [Mycoplasmataceae bacterium]